MPSGGTATLRYFCCRLTPSGIGDQLSQLARLYDLGRRLGLEYLYRPLPRNRWSPGFDADDFLGLGLDERQFDDCTDHVVASVDAANAARALDSGRPLETLLPAGTSSRTIVELVHSDSMYTLGAPVHLAYPLDLRHKLIRRHGTKILERERPDELAMCVHVRQGDCTWVRRGRHYVFLGMAKVTSDPQDVDLRRAPSPESYYPLLDAVVARIGSRPCSITIFSDGPASLYASPGRPHGRLLFSMALRDERVIRWLRLGRRGNPLRALYNPLSDPEVAAAWDRARDGLNRLAARYPNVRLVTGTGRELTERAIVSFATADVAVLARSRRAFPLLDLGDPAAQAVLLLTDSVTDNTARLESLLARRDAKSQGGDVTQPG